MSEFASYCTFVRNKHSKSAAWQDDLLNAAQANPELAGAAVGGLGGAATGLFSGNMLRNGLIGAGLGAGAGFGYRHRGDIADLWNGKTEAPAQSPLAKAYNTPQPTTSGVAAPGKPDGKSIGETVGPLKQMGLPTVEGAVKAPSKTTVGQQQSAADSATKRSPEAPLTEADDIRKLNTKAPGNPLATLMGGKPVGEGDTSTDAMESNLGQVPVQPTRKEEGMAAAAKRNHTTAQIAKAFAPLADSKNPKAKLVKELLEARMTPVGPDGIDPDKLRKAEELTTTVDNISGLPGELASAAGRKMEAAGDSIGKGWETVGDWAGAPGRMLSSWGDSMARGRAAREAAEAAAKAKEEAAFDQILEQLRQAQQ